MTIPAEDFVSIEMDGRFYEVRVWTADGKSNLVLVTTNQGTARDAHEAIADAIRTW